MRTALLLLVTLLVSVAPAAVATAAPPDITGTWTGPVSGAFPGQFVSGTCTITATAQSGRMFYGTLVLEIGGNPPDTFDVAGSIVGHKVSITSSENNGGQVTTDLIEATLSSMGTVLRGTIRSLHGAAGYFSLQKQ